MNPAATILDANTGKPIKVITMDEKLSVKYCIENWLRDEQIKLNCSKVKGRVEAVYEKRSEPIAIVNFGPSLNDTWEGIKKFKYVMSCSGAHKFLVEHGIIPTYHLDVDPRPHKVQLIGQPQKETQYLIASTCHPSLCDLLADYDLKLWHIFDTTEDGLRLLPHGEWSITGGCSVGVRTLTMARFLGFVEQHVFGMDGAFGVGGKSHAADHPNAPKGVCLLEYPEGSGRTYNTTPAMLEAAKNTFHELDMMKDTNVQFYGEGLVQEMAKAYVRKSPKSDTFIGFNKPELISAEYRELNKRLHVDNLSYGVGGGRHAETVLKLAESISKEVKFVSVLDYGCGKSYLAKALPFPIAEYDPAVLGKEDPPKPADLVCCFDVLEHIEPDKLDFVLSDLARCTRRVGYFIIHTKAAAKVLADGRNAHLIQEGLDWWKAKLSKFFTVPDNAIVDKSPLIHAVVGPTGGKHKRKAKLMTTNTAAQ